MEDKNNIKKQQKQQFLQVPDKQNQYKLSSQQQQQQQQQYEQQQQRIQKKHSGPLDFALNELKKCEEAERDAEREAEKLSSTTTTTTATTITTSKKHTHGHAYIYGHGRKRERWLLTRKTWKFMQDAGRKLLPDNVQNRKEDIPLIEAHFQEICTNENKFLLWRRKVSFPGARRSSLRFRQRRLPLIRRHQQQQRGQLSVEQSADHTMELLAKYLHLDDQHTTTTALLSSKTQQPHQTVSPSAQRPTPQQQQQQQQQLSQGDLENTRNLEISQLLAQLQALSKQLSALGNENWLPKPETISRDMLENKTFMRQIYNALKRHQLHRQLSTGPGPGNILFRRTHSFNNLSTTMPILEHRKLAPPSDLNLTSVTTRTPYNRQHNSTQTQLTGSLTNEQKKSTTTLTSSPTTSTSATTTRTTSKLKQQEQSGKNRRIKLNTCGTQTNFIPLQEIKQLAIEYREQHQQQQQQQQQQNLSDELEKMTTLGGGRKSSIENADISPTVSDTIKRYLRMARRKSVVDKQQQQQAEFRRINYDRQLRQIRARGEINPPGMDEDNHKAVQTLEAWPVIMLDFIRNNESPNLNEAHREWQQQLDERIKRKMEYENKLQQQQQQQQQHQSSSSATTSPTSPPYDNDLIYHTNSNNNNNNNKNLFTSSQQFLSNLWHGSGSIQELSNNNNNNNKGNKFIHKNPLEGVSTHNTDVNMQKSKSSSHVGHFVTKKILRNRSKSQNRSASYNSIQDNHAKNYGNWIPSDNLTWISDTGERLNLRDTSLQSLSDSEYRYLQQIAMEKITELNIGIDLNLDKLLKKQTGLLPKKRSMTTTFFDIGSRKDDVSLFGNSLESCVAKDVKNFSKLNSLTGSPNERGSRNSIVSLFTRITPQAGIEASNTKLHESVRSCESLPTNSSNWSKGMSRSQCDIRNVDPTDDFSVAAHKLEEAPKLQVPNFVSKCIQYLEEFGLHTVGLFRVSTSKKRVKQLREEFEKNAHFQVEANTCPHDIATLLKEFLRDLPEPLINENLYKAFLQTQKIRNRRLQMEAISHLIKLLPITHRDTLYVLLKFLAKVSTHADDIYGSDGRVELSGNRMDSYNLATVFAPNILRSATTRNTNDYATGQSSNFSSREAGAQQQNMTDAINVVRTLIDHYEDIFLVPAELIHTIYAHMLDSSPSELNMLCFQKASQVNMNSFIGKCESLPTSPTMPTASTNLTDESPGLPPASAERKLFSREAVMHMNDATKTTLTSIQTPNPVKRIRSAKNSSILRRQSTPNELESCGGEATVGNDGVVTASLQISMAFKRQPSTTPATTPPPPATTTTTTAATATVRTTDVGYTKLSNEHKGDKTPKAPASITNIGGAILRSKTADFERINKQQEQQKQQHQQPTLYKRQQLIRSAKTTTLKKS